MNDTARQSWLGQGLLQQVTVNRPVPLPKTVETHPLRQAADKLERFALKLKKNLAYAAKVKHISDSITMICNMLYQEEIKAPAEAETAELHTVITTLYDYLLKHLRTIA
ncbi:hypothetical protein NCS52_00709000 [Fusarium sp. LHS14.1]|nr:hypothetical protein NCS52_00709000 [Fusarium sp. LHS14.1]